MELDRDVVNLAKAIRQTESGGNFDARGGSGEIGGYQYTPDTWAGASKKYGINVSLDQATPQQQNEVTYKRIKAWKDAGNNVGQIASMWNAGEGRPNAYKENWKGVNKFGVAYDTPAYAKKVATAYQQFKPQTAEAAVPAVPEPVEEKEPFSIAQLGKEIISPVTTMLARPFQAAQLGSEMVRQSRQNPELEANAKKYGDEAYSLSLQLRELPPGESPEREKLVSELQKVQNLATYYSGRLSKNVAYQPFSTDTLVKEAPQTFADVKKDVGRGIQTAAFGLGPLSGGAAFGAGMSLEEGNDLLSWDTAAYTAGGLFLGKAADIIGKPLLSASGKVIGKITPVMLKDAAAGGAKAMQAFMERNKILPDAVSKGINVGAEALERGADAPFKAAAAPFRQTDDKIIAGRTQALQDLEEKYAQLRNNAARNPKATAATRGRVARSNVLTEDNMVNKDGVIIGAKDAAKNYRTENIGEGESLVRKLLEKEGAEIDLKLVEREMKKVLNESFNGRELVSALNGLKREMAGLRLANKSGRIKLTDLHDAKVSRQPGSKSYESSTSKALDKQIARSHKQTIEKYSKENVKKINAEIGRFLKDAQYIESLQGKRIGSGKLGKAITTAGSAVAGAVAGGAVGGIGGAVAGSFAAKAAGERLASRGLKKALGKPTKLKVPKGKSIEAGKKRLAEKPLALSEGKKLALPPRSASTPIEVGPATTKKKGVKKPGKKAPVKAETKSPKVMPVEKVKELAKETKKDFGKFAEVDLTKKIEKPFISRFADDFVKKKSPNGTTYFAQDKMSMLNTQLKQAGHKGVNTLGDFKGIYALDKIIDNPALFKKYPSLREMNVVFADFHTPKKRGLHVDNTIYINSKLYLKDKDSLRSTIVHEVQHAKQDIRGKLKKFSSFEEGRQQTGKEYTADAREVDARRQRALYMDSVKKPGAKPPAKSKVKKPKVKPESVSSDNLSTEAKKYKNTLNVLDKDDAEYLERIFSADQVEKFKQGDFTHFRGGGLSYFEEIANANLITKTPQTLTQKLSGKVKDFDLKDKTIYHGTSIDNLNNIIEGGFKKGSDLPEEAFRGGGYGASQDSISFSIDPNISANFTGSSKQGVVFKTKINPKAKVVTVDNVTHAEELNEFVGTLKKKGVDAIYLSAEKEIVVINPKVIQKVEGYQKFDTFGRKKLADNWENANKPGVKKPKAKTVSDSPELEELKMEHSIMKETIEANPARQLQKYMGRGDNSLAQIQKNAEKRGGKSIDLDGKVTELGFDDLDDAQRGMDAYRDSLRRFAQLEEYMEEVANKAPNYLRNNPQAGFINIGGLFKKKGVKKPEGRTAKQFRREDEEYWKKRGFKITRGGNLVKI